MAKGAVDLLDLRNARILIVDDDPDTSALVRQAFLERGYERITQTASGEEALELLHEAVRLRKPYDLIILDLMLPGRMNGQAVYGTLKQTLDLAVVIFSAKSDRDDILNALKSGSVDEYITKPADLELLFLKCERALSHRMYARHIQKSHRRNQMMFLNILQVMAKVLEAKDPYTKFHSENVAKYGRQIAKKIGYGEDQLELIQIGGVLHDFGKIGIKEAVLNKPGALTNSEYETIKRHPVIASAILEPIEELRPIIGDIRGHHERWDGKGYPDKLQGEGIPIGARILCIADAYDAMTSSRAYHDPMPADEAQAELVRCRGAQFDPTLVDAFIEVMAEQAERRSRIVKLRDTTLLEPSKGVAHGAAEGPSTGRASSP